MRGARFWWRFAHRQLHSLEMRFDLGTGIGRGDLVNEFVRLDLRGREAEAAIWEQFPLGEVIPFEFFRDNLAIGSKLKQRSGSRGGLLSALLPSLRCL